MQSIRGTAGLIHRAAWAVQPTTPAPHASDRGARVPLGPWTPGGTLGHDAGVRGVGWDGPWWHGLRMGMRCAALRCEPASQLWSSPGGFGPPIGLSEGHPGYCAVLCCAMLGW